MFNQLCTILLCLLLMAGCTENKKDKMKQRVEALEDSLSTVDPDNGPVRDSLALALSDAYVEYADKFPDDTAASAYLFQASNLNYQKLGRASLALDYARKVYMKYPESSKAPDALFMTAFLQEQQNNIEEAGQLYTLFLERYPNHHFADDAQFSLEMLGKDETEVLDRLHKMGRDSTDSVQ